MLKIEGGVVFVGPNAMIKDAQIYESTIVFETPKGTEWTEASVKEYLDKHTEGDVTIAHCQIMDCTGYANLMRKKGEVESKMEQLAEKLKADFEQHMKQQDQPAYKRFLNKLINRS